MLHLPKSHCKQHLQNTCAFPKNLKQMFFQKSACHTHIPGFQTFLLLDHYRLAALFCIKAYSPY